MVFQHFQHWQSCEYICDGNSSCVAEGPATEMMMVGRSMIISGDNNNSLVRRQSSRVTMNCLEDDTTIWEPGETNQENGKNLLMVTRFIHT